MRVKDIQITPLVIICCNVGWAFYYTWNCRGSYKDGLFQGWPWKGLVGISRGSGSWRHHWETSQQFAVVIHGFLLARPVRWSTTKWLDAAIVAPFIPVCPATPTVLTHLLRSVQRSGDWLRLVMVGDWREARRAERRCPPSVGLERWQERRQATTGGKEFSLQTLPSEPRGPAEFSPASSSVLVPSSFDDWLLFLSRSSWIVHVGEVVSPARTEGYLRWRTA